MINGCRTGLLTQFRAKETHPRGRAHWRCTLQLPRDQEKATSYDESAMCSWATWAEHDGRTKGDTGSGRKLLSFAVVPFGCACNRLGLVSEDVQRVLLVSHLGPAAMFWQGEGKR